MTTPTTNRKTSKCFGALLIIAVLFISATATAGVGPLLETTWGQGGLYKSQTPLKDGEQTYPGCTTIASAQVLYYYRASNRAAQGVYYALEHAPLSGADVIDGGHSLQVDLAGTAHDFDAMASSLDGATQAQIDATATFIYHVGATLNAQFGGGEGSSATGKQIENAFRYQWGYNNISRRRMSIISKSAFGFSDVEWAQLIRSELDEGRLVLYMAQQADADAGHAFVIDGYDDDGLVHVNWGWGGHGNGWFDPNTLEDPSGRRWNRDAMIFRGLEPDEGAAAMLLDARPTSAQPTHTWHGAFSLVSLASGTQTGYGLTQDEAVVHPGASASPTVFLQWEVDVRDGARVELQAEGMSHATITYGPWNTRGTDRTYRNVPLPVVLDPSKDGFDAADGAYFTIAVSFSATPSAPITVEARPTTKPASPVTSEPAEALNVDGQTWHGNGSLISFTSGTKTGYGLTRDEAMIHPDSPLAPVVFFQWEIDGRDGRKLNLDAEGMGRATITYGSWADRGADITRTVSLPHTLDPASDGLDTRDGEYYVVKVAFERSPTESTIVSASITR